MYSETALEKHIKMMQHSAIVRIFLITIACIAAIFISFLLSINAPAILRTGLSIANFIIACTMIYMTCRNAMLRASAPYRNELARRE